MDATARKEKGQLQKQPWISYGLIVIELIVHLCIRFFVDPVSAYYEWGFIPVRPTLLSLIVHPFLQIGIFYTLRDVVLLWWIGGDLEKALGHGRYGLACLMGMLGVAGIHFALRPDHGVLPFAGMTGIIAPLLGAYIIRPNYPRVNLDLKLFSILPRTWQPLAYLGGGWLLFLIGTKAAMPTALLGLALGAAIGAAMSKSLGNSAMWRDELEDIPPQKAPQQPIKITLLGIGLGIVTFLCALGQIPFYTYQPETAEWIASALFRPEPAGITTPIPQHLRAFTPQTAYDARLLAVWDAGEAADNISELAFSPTGEMLAAQMDHQIQVWDVRNSRLLQMLSAKEELEDLAFNPQGELVAVGTRLWRWRIENGQAVSLKAIDCPTCAAAGEIQLSPDGQWLALVFEKNSLAQLWQIRQGNLELYLEATGEPAPWETAEFSPDSSRIAFLHYNEEKREQTSIQGQLWNIDQKKLERTIDLKTSGYIYGQMIGPYGIVFAAITTDMMKVQHIDSLNFSYDRSVELSKLWPTENWAINKDLIVTGVRAQKTGKIEIWDSFGRLIYCLPTPQKPHEYWPDMPWLKDLVFSPDGRLLAASINDQHLIVLWGVPEE